MTGCALCPRRCGCEPRRVARLLRQRGKAAHRPRGAPLWEEPPVSGTRGSGAIFFTGCSLRCVFCQNSTISAENAHGRDFDTAEFIALMQSLESEGAHNINLVTPTHFAGQIAAALRQYKPRVPVVYNCGGYESAETLRSLEGLVDVYLPDFKYADDALAVRLQTPRTTGRRRAARCWRWCARPAKTYDGDGLLQRGVVVRHLILPAHTRNSLAVLDLLAAEFPPCRSA